jgi:hypothetical protein
VTLWPRRLQIASSPGRAPRSPGRRAERATLSAATTMHSKRRGERERGVHANPLGLSLHRPLEAHFWYSECLLTLVQLPWLRALRYPRQERRGCRRPAARALAGPRRPGDLARARDRLKRCAARAVAGAKQL